MNARENSNRAGQRLSFPELDRGRAEQHAIDLIDRLSGIRVQLVRTWNRCEDSLSRNMIHDAEEQVGLAVQLLKQERKLRESG